MKTRDEPQMRLAVGSRMASAQAVIVNVDLVSCLISLPRRNLLGPEPAIQLAEWLSMEVKHGHSTPLLAAPLPARMMCPSSYGIGVGQEVKNSIQCEWVSFKLFCR
ncbi:uncharacterized protein TrAtP1_004038 [Trichoderma atroviride]|uniref:Uncharacterized protein n=1 Tax=Hypocrea atroviridis (strain ATCC 20476 / IMI 206040) TaxID=452589 RepID=G9P6X7_HYPAI|nr:uncharacterized protein TRIATDRAFT_301504 [Trichoderma atroviride IMI 206040]EHK40702.1 hypothetical protein TRIATDRAFT_301504 [Trichoderma atroviride IMI 206040]UKZ62805.1 hypothetical protein TrAtP1_004038 [Trichoderma atroviride]